MEVVQVTAVADKFHPFRVSANNACYVAPLILSMFSRPLSRTVPGRPEAPRTAKENGRFSRYSGLPGTAGAAELENTILRGFQKRLAEFTHSMGMNFWLQIVLKRLTVLGLKHITQGRLHRGQVKAWP